MKHSLMLGVSGLVLAMSFCAPAHGQTAERRPADGDGCCQPRGHWVDAVYEERRVQVWVDAVYRTTFTRAWTPPVYRTAYERVWRPPVTQCVTEHVWVPDQWETRTVIHQEGGATYTTRERVLICPGHHETRIIESVVTPAHCETVERQELVTPGCYREEPRQELVAPGHFDYRTERVCVRTGYWEPAAAG